MLMSDRKYCRLFERRIGCRQGRVLLVVEGNKKSDGTRNDTEAMDGLVGWAGSVSLKWFPQKRLYCGRRGGKDQHERDE